MLRTPSLTAEDAVSIGTRKSVASAIGRSAIRGFRRSGVLREQRIQPGIGGVDQLEQFIVVLALSNHFALLQFVRQVQRGQHGQAVWRDHLVGAAQLAHARVEHACGRGQAVAFRVGDADRVFAVEDADADR